MPEHAAQLAVMRLDHDRTHRRGIGAPGAGEVELQSPYEGEWLVGLERGLRELDVSWHDGGGERAWRRGDQRAQALLSLPAAARALLHTKEVRWLSELMAPDGEQMLPVWQIPGWEAMRLRSAGRHEGSEAAEMGRLVQEGGWQQGAWLSRCDKGYAHQQGLWG